MKKRAPPKKKYDMKKRAPPKKKYDMKKRARPKKNGSENLRAAKIVYDIRARLEAKALADLEIWHGMQPPPNQRG